MSVRVCERERLPPTCGLEYGWCRWLAVRDEDDDSDDGRESASSVLARLSNHGTPAAPEPSWRDSGLEVGGCAPGPGWNAAVWCICASRWPSNALNSAASPGCTAVWYDGPSPGKVSTPFSPDEWGRARSEPDDDGTGEVPGHNRSVLRDLVWTVRGVRLLKIKSSSSASAPRDVGIPLWRGCVDRKNAACAFSCTLFSTCYARCTT